MMDTLLGNELLALFLVITLGLLAGRIKIGGLTFGSSATIFVALLFGHLGYQIPSGVGTLGLVMFVYCIGLTAGPSFFRAFFRQGRKLSLLGLLLVLAGAATAWILAKGLEIPADLAVGLFAGALTSTPGLAAATEAVSGNSQVAVGYGIAYPVGVIGLVLFVQLLPRILGKDLDSLGKQLQAREEAGQKIVRVLVEVANPAVIGKKLTELYEIGETNCQVPRYLQGDRLVPVPRDLKLESGMNILLIGRESRVSVVIDHLGRRSDKVGYVMDTERERTTVVVSSPDVVGRSLKELRVLAEFGVTVSRITRHDLEFVPRPSDPIAYGDALNVVGEPEDLERFADFAGHRAETFDETDVISVGVGVIAGILLGMVTFSLGDAGFSLGMAGGPLFVALVLAHFGHLGPVTGHIPRASRLLLTQIGLIFFLADAGVTAGGSLVPILKQYGIALGLAAMVVLAVPLVVGFLFGRYILKLDLLSVLGGICGGMTSTPGLGAITAKTSARAPVISYAAAYPVALIFMTIVVQVLVAALG